MPFVGVLFQLQWIGKRAYCSLRLCCFGKVSLASIRFHTVSGCYLALRECPLPNYSLVLLFINPVSTVEAPIIVQSS